MTQTKQKCFALFTVRAKYEVSYIQYNTRHPDIWVFTGPTDITSGEGIQDTLFHEFSTGSLKFSGGKE